MNQLDWHKSTDSLPEIGKDVIGYNSNTGAIEFGFRSAVDKHAELWADFHFSIIYWAYANMPEDQ